MKMPSDTKLLDWMQGQSTGYGIGWIFRVPTTGRGVRLHETTRPEATSRSVRHAIWMAMDLELCGEDMDLE